ncbi:MAG: peroxiredoxin [Leptospirales bacterium]
MSQKKSFSTKIESFFFSTFGSSREQKIKEGDTALNYSLTGKDGDFEFKPGDGRWKIIYFYPKDNTPGCTTQAKTFTALKDQFEKLHTDILGISNDTAQSHTSFQKKHSLKINLYSDPSSKIADDFGIKTLKGMCARDTVVINPSGTIEKIYRGVDPRAGGLALLEYIENQNKTF